MKIQPRLIEYENFGGTNKPSTLVSSDQLTISGSSDEDVIFALAIAPESEIDCCWIIGPNGGIGGGADGGSYPIGDTGITTACKTNIIPVRGNYKLTKGTPLVGHMRGPLIASPFYFFSGTLSTATLTIPFGKLSLYAWYEPVPFIPSTIRAPLNNGWKGLASQKMMVPTFGRSAIRIWATSDGAAYTLGINYGFCSPQDGQVWDFNTLGLAVPATGGGAASLLTSDVPDFLTVVGTAVVGSVRVVAID